MKGCKRHSEMDPRCKACEEAFYAGFTTLHVDPVMFVGPKTVRQLRALITDLVVAIEELDPYGAVTADLASRARRALGAPDAPQGGD